MSYESILEIYHTIVKKYADKIAITYCKIEKGYIATECVTYAELNKKATCTQRLFEGVQVQDQSETQCQSTVALFIDTDIDFFSALYGTLKMGWIFAPFDVSAPDKFNAHLLVAMRCDFVIVGKATELKFMKIIKILEINCMIKKETESMTFSLWTIKYRGKYLTPQTSIKFAYTMHTSGTTGDPKVIRVSQRCILTNVMDIANILKINSNDQFACITPPTFDPFIIETFVSLYCGIPIVLPSKQIKMIPKLLCESMFVKNSVTVLQCTPSFFNHLLSNQTTKSLFNQSLSLRVIIFGGEECPTGDAIANMIPSQKTQNHCRFFNFYGVTEISCWAFYNVISKTDIDSRSKEKISLGKPFSGMTLSVCDKSGATLMKIDQNDEIEIKEGLPNTFNGEVVLGSHREERFCQLMLNDGTCYDNKIVKTGDWVKVVQSNNSAPLIYFEGRMDGIFKRNGKMINLNQIKNIIEAISNVTACHVSYTDDQELIAFVVFDENKLPFGVNTFLSENLKMKLKTLFPAHANPDEIIEIDKMSVTSHGKIDAKYLLSRFYTQRHKIKSQINFKTYLQNAISKTLNCPEFCNIENKTFLELGGDSIKAVKIINKINLKEELKTDIFTLLFTDTLQIFVEKILKLKTENDTIENISKKRQDNSPALLHKPKKIKHNHIWKFNTGKCVDASPVILNKDGRLLCFIGSHSHYFFCLNANDGSEIWKAKFGDRIESSACVTHCGKYVAVGCYDMHLYVLHTNTGKVHLKHKTGSQIKSSPCVASMSSSDLYFASHDGCLRCIDVALGKLNWKTDFQSGSIFSSPCYYEGKDMSVVYCGTLSGCMYSVDSHNGATVWCTHLHKPIFSSAQCCDVGVCVGCVDNSVYMLCHSNGYKLWKYDTSAPVFASPCIYKGNVYIGSHDQRCHVVSTKNGALKWKTDALPSAVYSSPKLCIINQVPYVIYICTNGSLFMSQADDGSIVSSHTLSGEVFSSPVAISDGIIIVGCRDNSVYCLEMIVEINR